MIAYVPRLDGWRADAGQPDADAGADWKFRDNKAKILSEAVGVSSPGIETAGVLDLRKWCSPVEDQGHLGSCFVGDTLVRLLDGTKRTLRELHEEGKEFWIYSCASDGAIVPGKAIAKLTGRNKQVIRIVLDNGEEIFCTPDHRWLLRDGTYCEAKDLKPETSLMPLYVKYDKRGYQMIFDNKKMTYVKTHNMVAYAINSHQIDDVKEEVKCVHHKDFNKRNNNPDNLKFMGLREHFEYHSKETPHGGTWYHGSKKQSEDSRRTILNQYTSNPAWNLGAASKGGKRAHLNRLNDAPKMKKFNDDFVSKGHTKESRVKANESFKHYLKNRTSEQAATHSKNVSEGLKRNHEFITNVRESMRKIGSSSGRAKLIKYANRVLFENKGVITLETWNATKNASGIKNFSKFESISKYFDSIEDLCDAAMNYNHKVVSVNVVEETQDVYCLTVDNDEHNFALACGVFVHNCVGNSVVGALEFLQLRAGRQLNDLSRLFVYYNSRLMHHDQDKDSGTYIRLAFGTLSTLGTCSESIWPYDTSKVFVRPRLSAYRDGYANKIGSYYSIDSAGSQRVDDVKEALRAQHPVVFGMYVDNDYIRFYGPGTVPMPRKTRTGGGGHAQLIVGYDDNNASWLVRNSWGTAWGDAGYAWVPYDYVDASDGNDFWVATSLG